MKILIIKPSSFGDIVQANPVISALKSKYPDCIIHWLVFKKFEGIIDIFEGVGKKIVWDRSGGIKEYLLVLKRIRRENYDIVLDLQGLIRTALIARFSKGKTVLGVPGLKEFSNIFIKEVYPENGKINATRRNLEPLRYLFKESIEVKFSFILKESIINSALNKNNLEISKKYIGLVPGARGPAKSWPVDYYKKLIGMLSELNAGYEFIIFGSDVSVKTFAVDNVIDLSGKTSLRELACVLSKLKLVIGSDSGPAHLASALGVKTIMIFGGSDITETSPVSENTSVISKYFDCSPCRSNPKCDDYRCLSEITPDEVFDKAREVLGI